jgi:hypothetical protein
VEKLTKCKFNLSSKEEGMQKHKNKSLSPESMDIAPWADATSNGKTQTQNLIRRLQEQQPY